MKRALLAASLAVVAGCGATAETRTVPRSDPRPTVELSIRDPRHGLVHVGDLRGRVVIVVVLSTYDTMSQVEITELSRFAALRPEVAVVGVLMQQGAEQLSDAFVLAIDPAFPVGADIDGVIASGSSAFGPITTVPTLFALDRAGHVIARREGYQPERILEAMVLDADVRVPAGEVTQPPLLGRPSQR